MISPPVAYPTPTFAVHEWVSLRIILKVCTFLGENALKQLVTFTQTVGTYGSLRVKPAFSTRRRRQGRAATKVEQCSKKRLIFVVWTRILLVVFEIWFNKV